MNREGGGGGQSLHTQHITYVLMANQIAWLLANQIARLTTSHTLMVITAAKAAAFSLSAILERKTKQGNL